MEYEEAKKTALENDNWRNYMTKEGKFISALGFAPSPIFQSIINEITRLYTRDKVFLPSTNRQPYDIYIICAFQHQEQQQYSNVE